MAPSPSSIVRSVSLSLACLAIAAAAQAQTAPETPPPAGAGGAPAADGLTRAEKREEGRRNQKIERIHVDDGGAKVDELRYGGQTQSITVQPKGDLPAYEIQPADTARSRSSDSREGMAERKQRVWNVLNF